MTVGSPEVAFSFSCWLSRTCSLEEFVPLIFLEEPGVNNYSYYIFFFPSRKTHLTTVNLQHFSAKKTSSRSQSYQGFFTCSTTAVNAKAELKFFWVVAYSFFLNVRPPAVKAHTKATTVPFFICTRLNEICRNRGLSNVLGSNSK